jgi:GT2 family glycosyltransferase
VALPALRAVSISTTAVIVHFYGGSAIDACVRSLLAGTKVPARIVVIDNGSDPGWEAVFQRDFPGVLVVRNPRNLGFAGALPGTAATYATGPDTSEAALLVLNQDAEVDRACLARLEEALRHPGIGIVCPVVVDHHGRLWASGGAIHPVTARAQNVVRVHDATHTGTLADVDYAPGCAMLVRAEVWRQAGGLEARFFMYFEDADLAVRVRKLGYRVVCDRGAVCRHEGSSAAGGEYEPFQSYFRLRNRVLFVSRNFGLVRRTIFCLLLPLLLIRDAYRYARLHRWSAFCQVLAGLRTVRHCPRPPATRSDNGGSSPAPSQGESRTRARRPGP